MMSSQVAQGWHPNPQLMQPPQQQVPPAGWTGSWPPGGNVPFPPGYPGPPPMPTGAGEHPRWNAGFWQYNPQANTQNAQQPWAPGMGWYPPNYNPYKRVPKPPSPSYWNTKLTDNGLGLEGMVKRKEPSEHTGEEPPTPWIWNPPSLLESGDRATPTRDFNNRRTGSLDSSTRSASTPIRDYGQSSRGPLQGGSSTQAHSQTPERGTRPDYFYNSRGSSQENHHPATSGPTRHSSDPYDTRLSQTGAGSSGPSSSNPRTLGQADSWPSRARSQPPAAIDVPPFPAPTPTPTTNSRSAPSSQAVFSQEPESFTSKGELHPTFSSNIIRTPTHYQHSRRSMDDGSPGYYHPPSPSPPGASPSRGPPAPEPLARQSSLPNATSRDIYSNFTQDLSNSLNPTASSRKRSSGGGTPLSRSRTEPVIGPNLSTILESSSTLSSGEPFLAPLCDDPSSDEESSLEPSPRPRDRRSPYPSRHSPEPSPRYRDVHPSSYPSRHSPERSPNTRDRRPSPYSGSSRRDNPLPPPPVERPNPEASRPPAQEPPPATYSHKVRMGLWNRRGDHLTPNSFVVYAPHDRAYPEELREYPDVREGYKDQFDSFVPWLKGRPELPASLPYHGRAPAQPYESFVVYTYLA
ncbi:hypothetical protein PAXINDRAFT_169118 [Paxillus involutus ATCC 200175]|uniref:Uncharacterized protein n=1 Tax=Paxillus involutus ATCC 200175 TaxID=664439 RepID=A0A0C9U8C3_PAXIN|nr:hypothetical protein PAXINDRAFT_169118 [Paxillus involutus ATCC 200175]